MRELAAPAAFRSKRLLRKLHQTIAKITVDFEGRWHFNTCVAAIMELVNEIQAADAQLAAGEISAPVVRELLRTLVLLLAPFAPFLSAELWEELGEEGRNLARALAQKRSWAGQRRRDRDSGPDQRQADHGGARACRCGFQNNGGCGARPTRKFESRIAGKTVVKVIVVPGRAVNLVVK